MFLADTIIYALPFKFDFFFSARRVFVGLAFSVTLVIFAVSSRLSVLDDLFDAFEEIFQAHLKCVKVAKLRQHSISFVLALVFKTCQYANV